MEYQKDVNPEGFMRITNRVQRKTQIRSHLWDHVGMSIWPNGTHITWNQVQTACAASCRAKGMEQIHTELVFIWQTTCFSYNGLQLF